MQKIYEFINFEQIETKGKTTAWSCRNKHHGEELGVVKWYGAWRQYCYLPSCPAVYSKGCLEDVVSFIQQLMDLRK